MPETEAITKLPFWALQLSGEQFKGVSVEPDHRVEGSHWLAPLSTLNVIIGPNNSGKSRVLRGLFQNTFGVTQNERFDKVREVLAYLSAPLPQKQDFLDALSKRAPAGNNTWTRFQDAIRNKAGAVSQFASGNNASDSLKEIRSWIPGNEQLGDVALRVNHATELLQPYYIPTPQPTTRPFKCVYVPVLRGLRPPVVNDTADYFKTRTIEDYFRKNPESGEGADLPKHCEIFTGLGMYKVIQDSLLGEYGKREAIAAFENFLQRAFYPKQRVTIIPSLEKKIICVKIGDEKEQQIFHLGDGLQHLLIMLCPLFLYRDSDLLLFIEEPELFLHQGHQRLLVDALLDE